MIKRILLILLLLSSAAFGAPQTCTWNGAIDSDWSNAGNWDTTVEADRVPVDGDAVLISGAVDCDMPGGAQGTYTSFIMAAYTGLFDFAGSNIDVDGEATLGTGFFADTGGGGLI